MSDEFTGGGVAFGAASCSGHPWERNTFSSDARCDAYDVPRERSASARSRKTLLPAATDRTNAASATVHERAALRNLLRTVRSIADTFVDAVCQEDILAKGIYGCDLLAALDTLWEMRTAREEEWAESLNFLQSAIRKEEFERFNQKQGEAVASSINVLAGGTVDPEDVLRVRRALREAGLDPWKAVSEVDARDDG